MLLKLLGGKIGHIGVVTSGMFKKGDVVKLAVNKEQRSDTAKNHSATHLLQKALRIVLGSHVENRQVPLTIRINCVLTLHISQH